MKKYSVKEVVEKLFNNGKWVEVNIYTFVRLVQRWLDSEKRFASEGSILRRLRELRVEDKINYEVVNSKKGTYRKLEVSQRRELEL